jgi:hypothetical protein
VPEKFQELQWTRLPGGERPPAFVERVLRLLSPETSPAPGPARAAGSPVASAAPAAGRLVHRRAGVVSVAIVAVALLAIGYLGFERMRGSGVLELPNRRCIGEFQCRT